MTTKELWVVTISAEVVVLAEDSIDAVEEARSAIRDGSVEPEPESAGEMTYLPDGWDLDCLPYGGDNDDETLGVLIEAGAAPKYRRGKP